jgi:hypothetical protein
MRQAKNAAGKNGGFDVLFSKTRTGQLKNGIPCARFTVNPNTYAPLTSIRYLDDLEPTLEQGGRYVAIW